MWSNIYRAVCGPEIPRLNNVESLQARRSVEIFWLLNWREMRRCSCASVFTECRWEMFTTAQTHPINNIASEQEALPACSYVFAECRWLWIYPCVHKFSQAGRSVSEDEKEDGRRLCCRAECCWSGSSGLTAATCSHFCFLMLLCFRVKFPEKESPTEKENKRTDGLELEMVWMCWYYFLSLTQKVPIRLFRRSQHLYYLTALPLKYINLHYGNC